MSNVEVAPHGPRPPIRLRPVPRCDPPYDDELEPQWWITANQLAFEWPRPPGHAAVGDDARGMGYADHSGVGAGGSASDAVRPGGSAADAVSASDAVRARDAVEVGGSANSSVQVDKGAKDGGVRGSEWLSPRHSGSRGSERALSRHEGSVRRSGCAPATQGETVGNAKLAVRRFVHMCVEVLNGFRPAAHLRRLALPKDAAGVVAQAVAGTGRVSELRGGLDARRTRAANRRERGPGPVAVLKLQLSYPRPGAVEATILLVTGERTWAMALRMELHGEMWAATTLRLV